MQWRCWGIYCFSSKLMWFIWTMWPLSTLPEWPMPRHTQGQLELHWAPFFTLFCFVFLKAIRNDVCPPFYHKTEQTKQQPVVICTVVFLPLRIYIPLITHTHTWLVPGCFLQSCCFIVLADPISLPLRCDFSFPVNPCFTAKRKNNTPTCITTEI